MKKKKITQLTKSATIASDDEFPMIQKNTSTVQAIAQSLLSKSILTAASQRLRSLYVKSNTGNLLNAFSTWTLGPNWSIDTSGDLVNNTIGEMYGHTETNVFTPGSGKTYIVVCELTELDGIMSLQLHSGTSSYKTFNSRAVGNNFFMFEGEGVALRVRIYGNISNKIRIKSMIICEMKLSDLPLVIETALRNI